jgi:GLTT repeat (6 copies)
MIRRACGASDDTQAPRTPTSRRRYRFHAFAEAFFLGGFRSPLPETARARTARDPCTSVARDVALDRTGPTELDDASVELPAAPAPLATPVSLAVRTAGLAADETAESARVAAPVGDDDPDVPRSAATDDGAVAAGVDARVVADGAVTVGEVPDGAVATGVVTFGVVAVGVVTFGVVTVGVVTLGVVTVGVVTVGVVTLGVVTVGVVTLGVVTVGVVTLGVVTVGVVTLGVVTVGVVTVGVVTLGVVTVGVVTLGVVTVGVVTLGVVTVGVVTAGVVTFGAVATGVETVAADTVSCGTVSCGTPTDATVTDEVDGSSWSADATAARRSARPMMVAARRVRRRVRPARLDPDTTTPVP